MRAQRRSVSLGGSAWDNLARPRSSRIASSSQLSPIERRERALLGTSDMRVRIPCVSLVAVLFAAGCASEYHPEYHPVSSYTVNQSVSYPTIYQVGSSPSAPTAPTPAAVSASDAAPTVDRSHVAVVEASRLDRPGEVVAVLDLENTKGTHDSGIALLRERAAELGADAVVSVELHRGEGGRPAHASGLAVRFDRSRASRE